MKISVACIYNTQLRNFPPTGSVILSNQQGGGGGVGTDQLGDEVGEGQVQVGQVSLVRLQSKQVILKQIKFRNI
jgi:hypothetical protein